MRAAKSWPRQVLAALLTAAPFIARAATCQGEPTSARLEIVVDGVRSGHGLMTASLYADDPGQFLKKNGAIKVWRDAARAPGTTMCIWLPRPGTYAVAVYHDANSNQKLDIGPFGPREGYGFSNNARALFALPTFEAARFVAKAGDTILHVRLRYP